MPGLADALKPGGGRPAVGSAAPKAVAGPAQQAGPGQDKPASGQAGPAGPKQPVRASASKSGNNNTDEDWWTE
jgi:hypothetical protein